MNIRKKLSGKPFYLKLSQIKNFIKGRERSKTYGQENPDKVFYVIGQNDMTCGLWWIVNKVVMHLAYADEKGYIPVVDYLHFTTQYHNIDEIGVVNVWEKFFMQPCDISITDIKRSRNIILSDKYSAPSKKYLMGNTDFYTDLNKRQYFASCFHKYIRLAPTAQQYLENIRTSIIPAGTRVLGVLCRGTDYAMKRPKGHPIPPQPHEVIIKSAEIAKVYKCDYIFLATEDADILEEFKNVFQDRLLFVKQNRVSKLDMQNVNKVMSINIKINEDRYKMGLDYLSATYILSKCNCFIGVRCGGTKGVLLMSNGFEFEYIYNLGIF